MVVQYVSIVLLIYFNGVDGYTLNDDSTPSKISWPSRYHFTGETIDFISKLVEPFEVWYNAEMNRSRVAYYGGKDEKYYYADKEYIYDVHMVTNKDLEMELGCFGTRSIQKQKGFLPLLTDLVYAGTDYFKDKEVEVWKSKNVNDIETKTEKTLYVYRTKLLEDVPVRLIHKSYNLETGALSTHIITNYNNFGDAVTDSDLTFKDEGECIFLSGNFKQDLDLLHPKVPAHVDAAFDSYKKHHGRNYEERELEMRRSIFEKRWRMVHDINSKNLGYKLTLNKFSDRTEEELKYLMGTRAPAVSEVDSLKFPHSDEEVDKLAKELPKNLDLRMEGVITPIKNQGSCGSCWAFSTTATVEGLYARNKGGALLDLSEQSLIDCAWGYQNFGCDGGTLNGAMKFVSTFGIPTEAEYGSYMEKDGLCDLKNMSQTYKISGFAMVTPRNPNALKVALQKYGPVAVNIHASDTLLQYANGIFYDFTCEGQSINHGVTVVGYGVRDGEEYWIVKNSWGEAWGEDGYVLLSARNNNCLLLDLPFYPFL